MTGYSSFGDRVFFGLRSALTFVSTWVALAAGALMLGLALMSVVSIIGRWLAGSFGGPDGLPWLGAIRGDYEIMEIGAAIAIFGFLPYCQLRYTHVTIDLFVYRASARIRAMLTFLAAVLFALVFGLLCWRTFVGMQEMITYSEVTMMRRLPLWWAFSAGAALLGLTTVIALFTAWESWRGLLRGFDPASHDHASEINT